MVGRKPGGVRRLRRPGQAGEQLDLRRRPAHPSQFLRRHRVRRADQLLPRRCSTTACWRSRPIRAASRAAASPAAPRSWSMSATSRRTASTPLSPSASAGLFFFSLYNADLGTICPNTRATTGRPRPASVAPPTRASAVISSAGRTPHTRRMPASCRPAASSCRERRNG